MCKDSNTDNRDVPGRVSYTTCPSDTSHTRASTGTSTGHSYHATHNYLCPISLPNAPFRIFEASMVSNALRGRLTPFARYARFSARCVSIFEASMMGTARVCASYPSCWLRKCETQHSYSSVQDIGSMVACGRSATVARLVGVSDSETAEVMTAAAVTAAAASMSIFFIISSIHTHVDHYVRSR